jgi:hypothetical protein
MTADELRQLLIAPEMVVVDLLDHCLDALRLAMLAEHPLLDDELAVPDDPPVQRRARALLRHSLRLHRALDDYRREVRAVLREHPADDMPF